MPDPSADLDARAAAPGSPEPAPLVFDRPRLARFCGGDAALEQEIVQLFVGQLREQSQQLVAAADAAGWERVTHTLRGCAATVGADAIAEAARRAERLVVIEGGVARRIRWRCEDDRDLAHARLQAIDHLEAAAAAFIAEWRGIVDSGGIGRTAGDRGHGQGLAVSRLEIAANGG